MNRASDRLESVSVDDAVRNEMSTKGTEVIRSNTLTELDRVNNKH